MVEFPEERTYRTNVHIGNWLEDQALEDEKIRDFLEKRNQGELLLQKKQKISDRFMSPLKIDLSRDGSIHFGDKVLIKHPGFCEFEPRNPCLLAASLGPNALSLVPSQLPSDEFVSALPKLTPTVRTTFVIKGNNELMEKEKPLTYGEEFELWTTSGCGANLRLYSARRSFTETSRQSTGQIVKLVPESSRYTRWRILSLNTGMQMEIKGHRVGVNEMVLINHLATNHNLALEWTAMFPGIEGAEFEVTTHSYYDGLRRPMEANRWMIHLKTAKYGTISPDLSSTPNSALLLTPPFCDNVYKKCDNL